jgi:hypothetical protein
MTKHEKYLLYSDKTDKAFVFFVNEVDSPPFTNALTYSQQVLLRVVEY